MSAGSENEAVLDKLKVHKGSPLSETLNSPLLPSSARESDHGSVIEPHPDNGRVPDSNQTLSSVDGLEPTTEMVRLVAPGEALQLVRFARRADTLMITGVTPHGRRLTFEQRADREGWYVVAAGRRRRPTERELGLVVASITQEMEAAQAPREDREEIRSAYRLATSSDQPGLPGRGLQAYRDLLLDEAEAFINGQVERLTVVAVEYQAFKRFAVRHSHRIGAAFVRALGERLQLLFGEVPGLHACHKAGKSFRLIVRDLGSEDTMALIESIAAQETRQWIVDRVWGDEPRTHIDEVHFKFGFAMTRASDKKSASHVLAQRLNDDAFRAAKLGQLQGHIAIQMAKIDYRTTVYRWNSTSEDELEELANQMDDGPAEVMAEMMDYLHELVPVDLEGMAVQGDVRALVHAAIARDGFWQGSVAMRIAGERLLHRFRDGTQAPEGENDYVAGFELGDEFYGLVRENGCFYFAWGDLNSAGATRIRSGLGRIRHAVGWGREDGGGIMGHFIRAMPPDDEGRSLVTRVRDAAYEAFEDLRGDKELRVNDSVDIADYLWTTAGELITNEDVVEGAELVLLIRGERRMVQVVERRSRFTLRLDIDGKEHVAAFTEGLTGPYIKLRIRDTVLSAAICVLEIRKPELEDLIAIVREDNLLPEDTPMNVLGFVRHMADLLLAEQVKGPGKIELALGATYHADRFVRVFTLEEVRDRFPGLFYEAIHHELLEVPSTGVDRNLRELIAHTMLARNRPSQDNITIN
ncbi:MAG: hypothetical protein KTR25_13055 [Myxococcales bacterium]|nr:hypothetical protein [Myxococcales bacterium]